MNREEKIDAILNDLVNSGSELPYINELKTDSMESVKKDIDLAEVLDSISDDIKEETYHFLTQKNKYDVNYISGISSCIFLPSKDGDYKLKLIGGSISRDVNIKVNENTIFDIASITKLFTLLLVFKLDEEGIIDLNSKICDVNPDFQKLEDFTFNDLIRLHGELRTDGLITSANNFEEAERIFKTMYLYSNNREENKYTDLGAMVIGNTLEKIISNKLGRDVKFDEVMDMYLIKPLGLNNTMFNPKTSNVSGNGNLEGLVHDPKARILGGALGHAGLFSSSDDLARLAKNIFTIKYVNKDHINRLGEITFPNSPQSNKGNLGLYIKSKEGYNNSYNPPDFSLGSFSHQGWTGQVATFDPNNMIHNSILVNAIYNSNNQDEIKNNKPFGFRDAFSDYQINITKKIMLMYVVKKYYNKYCNQKADIDVVKNI